PGWMAGFTCWCVAARIRPPAAMVSSSRALLSWITADPRARPRRAPPRSLPDGLERALRDLVERAHRVDALDLRAVRHVPVENRRRLLAVDAQPVADRVRLVVLAAHERAAVAGGARGARLEAGERLLALLAGRAPG